MRRFLGLSFTVAAVAATLGLCAGQALANHVGCGDTITADTILDSDLSCERTGIVVGADGIRLDLRGHAVQSDTTAIDSRSRNDVTIEGGTTRAGADGTGVLISGARNRIHGITAIGGDVGIWVEASSDSVIAGNSVSGASVGIFLNFTRDTLVTDNSLTRNDGDPLFGYFPASGILLWYSGENEIARNTLASNGTDVFVAGADNHIQLNRGRDSGTGVRIVSGSRNVIERNRFIRAGTGISLAHTDYVLAAATESTVRGNVVSHSSVAGISLLNVGGDEIVRNSVTSSLVGIRVEETYYSRVLENDISRSTDDGIFVTWGSGNVLDENTASRNGGDGLEVRPSMHVVRANVANHNGDLGIEMIGSVDAGGNWARGNGNPLQCLNVDCTK